MQRCKTLIIINAVLVCFLLFMLWIRPIDNLRKYNIYNHYADSDDSVLIYGDMSLTQTFTCTAETDSFELSVSPANDSYHGSYNVSLSDENGIVNEWTTEKLDTAKGWVQYHLKGRVFEPEHSYTISVCAPGLDVTDAIKVFIGSASGKASGVGEFSYSKQRMPVDPDEGSVLCFGVYRKIINVFAIAAIIIVFLAANICIVFKEKGMKFLSLPIMIASAFVMLLIMAPGSGPDDRFHYYSAFELSNILMGRTNTGEIENRYYDNLPIHHNTNEAFVKVYEELRYRIAGEEGTFYYDEQKDKLIQPLSHLAQALGITVGRVLGLNFIQIYTLARIANMSLYILLVYIAVRVIPVNRELMTMMGIMPMAMHQATQLSYDAVVNGMAFLFTGYIIKLIYDNTAVTWRNIAICAILLGIMSPIKVIYFLLGVLIMVIPSDRFRSQKDRIKKTLVVFIGVAAASLVTKLTDIMTLFRHYEVGGATVDRYNVGFAISNPGRFAALVMASAEDNLWMMIKGATGSSLAGMTLGIPEYLVIAFILVISICAIEGNGQVISRGWQRIIIGLMFCAGYILVFIVFAFSFTKYGLPYVDGIQGRYLIPFLLPVLYSLKGSRDGGRIDCIDLFIPVWFIELGYIVSVMSSIGT